MVVENSTPSYLTGAAPAAHEEPPAIEPPVPGGRHDLEADDEPSDPVEDLARLRHELGTPPEEWVPFQSSWQPSEQTWKPLAQSWEQARTPTPAPAPYAPPPPAGPSLYQEPPATVPAPVPAPAPAPREFPRPSSPAGPVVVTQTSRVEPAAPPPPPLRPEPPTVPAPAKNPPPATPAPAAPAKRGYPVVLWPLVAFNVVFDLFLIPLGPLGDWFKGRNGRGLLGAVGALCFLAAAALAVADEFGWTW
jgi:hypothetical protein